MRINIESPIAKKWLTSSTPLNLLNARSKNCGDFVIISTYFPSMVAELLTLYPLLALKTLEKFFNFFYTALHK